MKYFITLILGEIIGYLFCTLMYMPQEIEQRAKDLNLMLYDGHLEKFVPKDTIIIRGGELYYLINGKTK